MYNIIRSTTRSRQIFTSNRKATQVYTRRYNNKTEKRLGQHDILHI